MMSFDNGDVISIVSFSAVPTHSSGASWAGAVPAQTSAPSAAATFRISHYKKLQAALNGTSGRTSNASSHNEDKKTKKK